jgi:hypothetical protein
VIINWIYRLLEKGDREKINLYFRLLQKGKSVIIKFILYIVRGRRVCNNKLCILECNRREKE